MSASQQSRGQLVLIDESVQHSAPGAYKGLHALVPVLIGLSLPIVLFSMFDPRALGNTRLVLHILMMGVALVAATLFFLSLLNPGNVVQAVFDPERRCLDLVRSGAFANNVLTVPFDRIASVRIETAYDDDGYQQRVPLVVLSNRETYQLPAGTSEADIAAIRDLIGRR
jgi:hypothetical protein